MSMSMSMSLSPEKTGLIFPLKLMLRLKLREFHRIPPLYKSQITSHGLATREDKYESESESGKRLD